MFQNRAFSDSVAFAMLQDTFFASLKFAFGKKVSTAHHLSSRTLRPSHASTWSHWRRN